MLYFDTSYVVRLYTRDSGWEEVRSLARSGHIACGLHGKAEAVAAFHRKFREGTISRENVVSLLEEFDGDCAAGAFRWLPVSMDAVEKLKAVYSELPATIALRSADAIHLACAAQSGFRLVYSNDKRLLEAAPYFGLTGVNLISPKDQRA